MSSERERIAKILTRPVTVAEKNRFEGHNGVIIQRIYESIYELADTLDLLRSGQLPIYKDGKLIQ